MTFSLLATLGVGFGLGLKHALDTDHLVAVSTLVARERNFWRATRIGAVWGLGHTATLFAMGLLIVILGLQIPESIQPYLKSAVAAMLIFLGARTLRDLLKGDGHVCLHEHEGHTHAHFHRHGEHECAQKDAAQNNDNRDLQKTPHHGAHRQSFLVGLVHGLSGSAELMLLVLTTIRHPMWGLAYIAIFGIGMMVGMFALTTLFSCALRWSHHLAERGLPSFDRVMRGATGLASLGFGLHLAFGIARELV